MVTLAEHGANLSTGGAAGHTDEKRMSNNVGFLTLVLWMCLTVPGHACSVRTELLSWNIIVLELRPPHNGHQTKPAYFSYKYVIVVIFYMYVRCGTPGVYVQSKSYFLNMFFTMSSDFFLLDDDAIQSSVTP